MRGQVKSTVHLHSASQVKSEWYNAHSRFARDAKARQNREVKGARVI